MSKGFEKRVRNPSVSEGLRDVEPSLTRGLLTRIFSDGVTRTVLTNPFGNYRFDEVQTGEIYILGVSAKGCTFNPSTRVLNVAEEIMNIDFTAEQ